MGYLATQMLVFLTIAMVIGAIVGWLVTRFVYRQHDAQCRTELAGLRRNYADVALQNATLHGQLRQLQKVLHKISTPPSDTDYGKFLQLRKALEKTRRQYQSLLDQFHQQEASLAQLSTELQASKQALAGLQVEVTNRQVPIAVLPPAPASSGLENRDDLTLIQGINQRLASTLQALGIVTYRQVAEFTSDDVHHIQRIIGTDITPPVEGWAQHARSLFQQQHPPLQA